MEVIQNLVPESKYSIKCPYSMTPEFYVVHNTSNDAPAENEIAYMIRNNDSTSFHYAIDDKNIVQGIPEDRNAWHAGDGTYGNGNRCGIGIEICWSASGGDRFIAAEKLAAMFIAEGLKEKGWDINRVMKHQDFSNKYCPHRTLDMGWQRFLEMVQTAMNSTNEEETDMKRYNTLAEIPDYAQPTIKRLMDQGALRGDENGNLNLSEDMIRIFVVLDRLD